MEGIRIGYGVDADTDVHVHLHTPYQASPHSSSGTTGTWSSDSQVASLQDVFQHIGEMDSLCNRRRESVA